MDSRASSPPLFRTEDLEATFAHLSDPWPEHVANTGTSFEWAEDVKQEHSYTEADSLYAEESENYGMRPPSPLPYVEDPFVYMAASPDPDPSPSECLSPILSGSSSGGSFPPTTSLPFALEAPSDVSTNSPATLQLTPEDALDEGDLDDDELDEYILSPSQVHARSVAFVTLLKSKSPSSPSVTAQTGALDHTTTTSESTTPLLATVSPSSLDVQNNPDVKSVPFGHGKKRSRQQVEEENKENEESQALGTGEPVAGPSTRTTPADSDYRAPKRAKQAQVLQSVEIPDGSPDVCGLNQGTCKHALTHSPRTDGRHLRSHAVASPDGTFPCSWSGCVVKAYAYADGIMRHVKEMHWGWRFVCGLCGADYGRNDMLKRHQKKCMKFNAL